MAGIEKFEDTMADINKTFQLRPEDIRTRMPLDKEKLSFMKEEKSENHNYSCLQQVYRKLERLEYDSPTTSEYQCGLEKTKHRSDFELLGADIDINSDNKPLISPASARTILNSPRNAGTIMDLASQVNSEGRNTMAANNEKDCWGDDKVETVEQSKKADEEPSINW